MRSETEAFLLPPAGGVVIWAFKVTATATAASKNVKCFVIQLNLFRAKLVN
jgi:hypothetical protein